MVWADSIVLIRMHACPNATQNNVDRMAAAAFVARVQKDQHVPLTAYASVARASRIATESSVARMDAEALVANATQGSYATRTHTSVSRQDKTPMWVELRVEIPTKQERPKLPPKQRILMDAAARSLVRATPDLMEEVW